MLRHHSRSYGKYTAWALGKSAEFAHSTAAHMRYERRTARSARYHMLHGTGEVSCLVASGCGGINVELP